eukprot:TRINITY_DN1386_c1_g1_i1.p1 TRINITY_DN1386_c1_g1~~TRINITY_DN1386_c1_g1_i1.p1  ORF type:complete len:471 (+),score=138.85 TRINITY_DN1386_c1_g1_i1:112-1524(+)
MGPILPKPVTTSILERRKNDMFRVGLASINGFREKQEDAHAMLLHADGWGFFGVFDGHCGPLCSKYVADRFQKDLAEAKVPMAESAISDMCLRLDKQFLDTSQEGGSTGTFAFVHRTRGDFTVTAGNVGDSRVVLGRTKTKACVSMTEDHKPNSDGERRRIEAAGGHVANNRVDGSLAVSRAFGDASYKTSTSAEQHKVIAVPEFKTVTCEQGDILLLCCDGVFEGDVFSNESVMQFVFDTLDQEQDLAKVAAAVCSAALEKGSKDNISVMLVEIGASDRPAGEHTEVVPGPFFGPDGAVSSSKFRDAYVGMCETAQISLYDCLSLRHAHVRRRVDEDRSRFSINDEQKTCDLSKLTEAELKPLAAKLKWQGEMDAPAADLRAHIGAQRDDCRPVHYQNLVAELAEMGDFTGAEDPKKYWDDQIQRRCDEGTTDHMADKVQELQRAGLPLPIILGLLAQQQQTAKGSSGT